MQQVLVRNSFNCTQDSKVTAKISKYFNKTVKRYNQNMETPFTFKINNNLAVCYLDAIVNLLKYTSSTHKNNTNNTWTIPRSMSRAHTMQIYNLINICNMLNISIPNISGQLNVDWVAPVVVWKLRSTSSASEVASQCNGQDVRLVYKILALAGKHKN